MNNQCSPPSPTSTSCTPPPGLLNNLSSRGEVDETPPCNKCKEEQDLLGVKSGGKVDNKFSSPELLMITKSRDLIISDNDKNTTRQKNKLTKSKSNYSLDKSCSGFINLAFVDNVSERATWYQPAISRDLAVKVLADCPIGSFIVRCSQTAPDPGSLALTVRVPKNFEASGIVHYLIQTTAQGFRIKGFTKVFPSLAALVVHHSVMREHLPCRLIFEDDGSSANSSPVNTDQDQDSDQDFADLDSDPEFPYLVDRLRKQLTL